MAGQPSITISQTQPLPQAVFTITVDAQTQTTHRVTLSQAYYERLTGARISPEELIRRAFTFLLEREPNTAILSEFDLPVIESYFPEFPDAIAS